MSHCDLTWCDDAQIYACSTCNLKTADPDSRTCFRGGKVRRRIKIRKVTGGPNLPNRTPTGCRHFGGPTGEQTETAKNCGCQTATGMTAIADCELHGRCTFVGQAADDSLPFCGRCADYQPGRGDRQ